MAGQHAGGLTEQDERILAAYSSGCSSIDDDAAKVGISTAAARKAILALSLWISRISEGAQTLQRYGLIRLVDVEILLRSTDPRRASDRDHRSSLTIM